MTRPSDLLVVGAGPTGLTLALQGHAHGARVRIVDRRPAAFRPSRALILHPRTLEVLRPLAVTEALLARADTAPQACLHVGCREVRIRLGELGLVDSPFPHLSLVRQMDVETVLAQALADRGVAVEWGTELVDARDDTGRAGATLRSTAGTEQTDADFIVGCDGPESPVRRCAGIGWHGGPYREEVVLADVELDADLASGVAHVAVGRRGLLFIFARGERATWRLLVTRPAGRNHVPFGQPGPAVPAAELQELLDDAGLDARITDLVWSARYRLQHRLAACFRRGRLFIAGDAAHAHSPATGQGMNTGIQDAINLGWKLAFAAAAGDRTALLDSYDGERRPLARRVLAITHLAFWGEASTSLPATLLRGMLAPLGVPALPALLRHRRLVGEAISLISQLRAPYRHGPLSVEGVPRLPGRPRAGDRLPDAAVTADGRRLRLHALLARPGVHVLLQRDAARLERLDFGPYVMVHRLTSTPGTGLVAIRPDGYIGFRSDVADCTQLRAWLDRSGAGGPADVDSLQEPTRRGHRGSVGRAGGGTAR
jgi:2-polyprenyl-6-methoxyphenol hydroxylase-like FAD-dependent oxidoreductase